MKHETKPLLAKIRDLVFGVPRVRFPRAAVLRRPLPHYTKSGPGRRAQLSEGRRRYPAATGPGSIDYRGR